MKMPMSKFHLRARKCLACTGDPKQYRMHRRLHGYAVADPDIRLGVWRFSIRFPVSHVYLFVEGAKVYNQAGSGRGP